MAVLLTGVAYQEKADALGFYWVMVVHPMKPGTYTVSSGYGPRWGTFHAGLDFACPIGTPIYAPADGTVVQGRERAQGSVSGFGSWIWLDCQASVGKDFIFGHVSHPGILVKAGDRVRAGQQIGVSGNEGESTGPHVHAEVWGAPGRTGGRHEDPAPFFAGAIAPGETASPPPTLGAASTLIGIDVSEWQDGLNLADTGVDFCIIRLAYGAHKLDRVAVSHAADWKTTGKPVSYYHYLLPGDSLTAQADVVKQQWDACGRGGGVWIDVEEPGITRAQVAQFRDALRARGVLVLGAYSRANFWESLPGGEPSAEEGGGAIWVSHYGSRPSGPIRQIYPGDSAPQWLYPLGDRRPDLWQYTDRATVPGWIGGVDANAYRGSVSDLRALFTGGSAAEEDDMTPDQSRKLDALYNQMTGSFREGEYPGFDIRALYKKAAAQDFKNLTMMEGIAVTVTESLLAGDQLSGPERKEFGGRSFTGWPGLGDATVVEMLDGLMKKIDAIGTAVGQIEEQLELR